MLSQVTHADLAEVGRAGLMPEDLQLLLTLTCMAPLLDRDASLKVCGWHCIMLYQSCHGACYQLSKILNYQFQRPCPPCA